MKTCACGLELVPEPVPGAVRYPRRLSCPACGYDANRPNKMQEGEATETPNDYVREVASPADVIYAMDFDDPIEDSRY